MKQVDIVLFGIQGSGKGTQAEIMLEKYASLSSFATWDVFRALMSKPNAIQDYVKRQVDNGKYVADAVTIKIFEVYVETLEEWKAMLLDWYPRSLAQLDAFLTYEKEQGRTCVGILFDLSEEDAVERMLSRWRHDDNPDAIKKRLSEYTANTQPVIDAFREKCELYSIDAKQSIDEIAKEVDGVMKKLS